MGLLLFVAWFAFRGRMGYYSAGHYGRTGEDQRDGIARGILFGPLAVFGYALGGRRNKKQEKELTSEEIEVLNKFLKRKDAANTN